MLEDPELLSVPILDEPNAGTDVGMFISEVSRENNLGLEINIVVRAWVFDKDIIKVRSSASGFIGFLIYAAIHNRFHPMSGHKEVDSILVRASSVFKIEVPSNNEDRV